MATAEQAPAEQRFLLYGIPWQTYVALRLSHPTAAFWLPG